MNKTFVLLTVLFLVLVIASVVQNPNVLFSRLPTIAAGEDFNPSGGSPSILKTGGSPIMAKSVNACDIKGGSCTQGPTGGNPYPFVCDNFVDFPGNVDGCLNGESCNIFLNGCDDFPNNCFCIGDNVCNTNAGENNINSPSDCAVVCGDGIIELGEACEDSDLNGQTCQSLGFDDGVLSCYPQGHAQECQFNTNSCLSATYTTSSATSNWDLCIDLDCNNGNQPCVTNWYNSACSWNPVLGGYDFNLQYAGGICAPYDGVHSTFHMGGDFYYFFETNGAVDCSTVNYNNGVATTGETGIDVGSFGAFEAITGGCEDPCETCTYSSIGGLFCMKTDPEGEIYKMTQDVTSGNNNDWVLNIFHY